MALLALTLSPGLASATIYNFTSGTATVSATAGATTILSPTPVSLTGVSVEFDDTGLGSLVDFLITMGPTDTLSLTPYGGYDEVVIVSADLSPGIGFANFLNANPSAGFYTFTAYPVDINGVYSATDSNLITPPSGNVAVPFTDNTPISGSVNINTGVLTLTGITLTTLPAALFPGESDDLVVKADIVFTGMVPEPTTGLLMGMGLVLMSAVRRSIR